VRRTVVGFRPLLEVSLKQDIRNTVPWIALISVLSGSSVLAFAWIFPDAASRAELTATVAANPALALIFGPARDLTTADGFNAWRAGALGAFFAGLMAIFIVVRNSRAPEDSGQAELVASGVVGRQTRLAVPVAMAWQASLALGVVVSTVTILLGGDVADSITLAATFTASGVMFAGIAAVAAQLGSDARAASSIAVSVLGVAFVARGSIDASAAPAWTIWLTPLGWTQEVRPAADNVWWPLLLCVALAVVTVAAAAVLHEHRDFGLGIIPQRGGPARGGAVVTPWGLAVRLNKGSLIAWSVAFALLGTVFGFLATTIGTLFAENPEISRLIAAGGVTEAGLVFEFLVTVLKLVGIIAAIYGVQIVLRVHAEELDFRVEPLLAGVLSRGRYLASNVIVAVVAPALAVLLAGTVIGVVATARDPSVRLGDIAAQAAATVPAVWVHVALAVALVGAAPGKRRVASLAVVASFGLIILGPIFNLWDWILGISPFWHVPNVTAASPDLTGLGWLGLVATALIAAGFAGFRRRDVG
jgi:ABC-2 type transport system permease protein